jgi:FlaA1/EpsC-like NDP-sugar epimerase
VTITDPEMTRFLLSINEAVDVIFAALKEAKSGEIFVPNVPAANVLNIAKVLIENRNIPIKITGVRPGEKLHEILISEEEIHHTVKRGNYYAISSMLPELQEAATAGPIFNKEFSSENHVISLSETEQLLTKHNLMLGSEKLMEGNELLV